MTTSLIHLLHKGRASLITQWTAAANDAYPFAAAGLIRSSQDPFANPIGGRGQVAAEALLTALTAPEWDTAPLHTPLEEFIRVRAIQDMPPDTAVGVIFAYKRVIRDYLEQENIFIDWELRQQLTEIEDRIDAAALLGFNLYAACREAFYNARLEDMRRRHSQVTRLAQREKKNVDNIQEKDILRGHE